MNLIPDPLAQLVATEAEWELAEDQRVVAGISARIRDLIDEGQASVDSGESPAGSAQPEVRSMPGRLNSRRP